MMRKIVYIMIGATLLGSCVPTSEFTQLSEKSNSLQTERDDLMAENEYLTVENREMRAKIRCRLRNSKRNLLKTASGSIIRWQKLENEIAQLERQYNDLESTHEALLRGNARETRRLLNELQTTQEDLARKQQLLKELEANVAGQRQDVNRLQAELEARNARLMEMEEMLI